MMKKKFYTEAAYLLGLLILALGTAFMESANFGMSMVVAPAYLVYLKLSSVFPAFTFGMAEYLLQAVLLVAMMLILRRFRVRDLFAFATTIVYGLFLDGCMFLVGLFPADALPVRIIFYLVGLIFCSVGVSLLFHTYLPPEVYELFVKEIAEKYGFSISKTKTCYDCTSCLVSIVLSFAFFGFGHFEGVKLGTILCALVNGWLIGQCSRFLESRFSFVDLKKHR